jgi:hypothetical protein
MDGSHGETSIFPVPSGLFNDPTYSAELQELQGPLLGRKYVCRQELVWHYLYAVTDLHPRIDGRSTHRQLLKCVQLGYYFRTELMFLRS